MGLVGLGVVRATPGLAASQAARAARSALLGRPRFFFGGYRTCSPPLAEGEGALERSWEGEANELSDREKEWSVEVG